MSLETSHLAAFFASFNIQTPHHFGRNGPSMVLLVGRRSQRSRRLPFSPVSTQFSALAKVYIMKAYPVRRARRHSSAGANPARQLSFQPVAVGADDGGNDIV